MCFKNNTDNLYILQLNFKVKLLVEIEGAIFTCFGVHQTNHISCQPECVIDLYFCFVLDEYS